MRDQFLVLLLSILSATWFPSQASQEVRTANDEPLVEDSQEAACEVLKARIAELYLDTRKPDQYWFCDFTITQNEYFRIVGLRSSAPRTDGATIYSNLVGWYAVARRSHVVLQWDVGEDRLIPESSERPDPAIRAPYGGTIVDDSQQAACEVLKGRLMRVPAVNSQQETSLTCVFSSKTNEYLYLVELRSVSTVPGQPTSTSVIGKFAVAKRSTVVLGIDETRNRIVPLREIGR